MLSPELLRKIQHIYIKSRYLADNVFAGEYETAFRGRGMEFEEVREYMPGDDIRSIDWNVSARMDRPFVKVFREEREQTVMLLVDMSASETFGSRQRLKKDVVTEVAAVLAYAAVKSNDKVGLIMFSDHVEKFIPPKKGRSHVWHVISEILTYKPTGTKTNLSDALLYLNRVLHRKSVCFVISDFIAQDFEGALKFARFRHDITAIMVQDFLEKSFPGGGLMSFRDLESGRTVQLDLTDARVREQFEARQAERFEKLKKSFRGSKVDFLNILTDEDYIDALLKFFRLREKRL